MSTEPAQLKLLSPAVRTESNWRLYGEQDLRPLSFIRHARGRGFEVDAIRELLAFAGDLQRPWAEVDAIAFEHLADIDSKLAGAATVQRKQAVSSVVGP